MSIEHGSLAPEEITEYIEVDISSKEFDNQFKDAETYMKFGTVRAKIADDGEKIQTILKDGTNETSNVASGGDYIVTNPVSGESWIIDKDKFEKKYQKIEGKSDEYKPKGAPVKAIVVDKNVRFIASWGEEQRIGKGGYIIETKDGERYGNAKDEFESTYSRY